MAKPVQRDTRPISIRETFGSAESMTNMAVHYSSNEAAWFPSLPLAGDGSMSSPNRTSLRICGTSMGGLLTVFWQPDRTLKYGLMDDAFPLWMITRSDKPNTPACSLFNYIAVRVRHAFN